MIARQFLKSIVNVGYDGTAGLASKAALVNHEKAGNTASAATLGLACKVSHLAFRSYHAIAISHTAESYHVEKNIVKRILRAGGRWESSRVFLFVLGLSSQSVGQLDHPL
jgi:hypothetical protein